MQGGVENTFSMSNSHMMNKVTYFQIKIARLFYYIVILTLICGNAWNL